MSIPLTPTGILLQTGNGNNLVTWNLSVGATSYAIQRSLDGTTFSNLGTSSSSAYLDTTASVGTSYYYQVAAVNISGTSAYGIPLSGSPTSITPCLPGQINLGYIRYLSKLRSDKLNSPYLTTDEWNSNINQSIFELADILTTKFGDDYFMAPPLLIPLTGIQFYPLPDGSNYPIGGVPSPAIYKLNGVDANISGGATSSNAVWVPLARSNWSDRDRFSVFAGQAGALNNVYSMSYREMGNNLFIWPWNTAMMIRIWYVPIQSQLLLDTDMLPFSFSGWSEYVIVDAAMKAMIKEESLEKWNALNATKQVLIERIETTAANRDVGQPNSVSNVRSSMGDPGFSGWGNGGFGGGSSWGGY